MYRVENQTIILTRAVKIYKSVSPADHAHGTQSKIFIPLQDRVPILSHME